MSGLAARPRHWRLGVVAVMASCLAPFLQSQAQQSPAAAPLSLAETLAPSPFRQITPGPLQVAGTVTGQGSVPVLVRVTTDQGVSSQARITARNGHFSCLYPTDFSGARPLNVGALFVDATTDSDFNIWRPGHFQAEITLIMNDAKHGRTPDISLPLTNDLLDQAGRTDQNSAQWPVVCSLVNLYEQSSGAKQAHAARRGFDLAHPTDLATFKNNLSLYDFEYRDRDWRLPLGHRPQREFWKAEYTAWFGLGNDNPQDGNPANKNKANYVPYSFTNDFADLLVLYWMRTACVQPFEANLVALCREATANLLALQYDEPGNLALVDARGKQEYYTRGAFRYGMFIDGRYMTEGTGWFYDITRGDLVHGGVFNGRALWALGEALKYDPRGPLAPKVREALISGWRFCLIDGARGGYAKVSKGGNRYWRDPGEHSYLMLGMLAVCETAPMWEVPLGRGGATVSVRDLGREGLNALCDLEKPGAKFTNYADIDGTCVAALAYGARLMSDLPDAARWRETAVRVADGWMAAKVDPAEHKGPLPLFGRRAKPDVMSFASGTPGRGLEIGFFGSGHWIHALARLYELTGDARYLQRANEVSGYLCGDNPFSARLFNETGGIYNWVADSNFDGVEDRMHQDMYPESTAFCEIGFLHLMNAIGFRGGNVR